MRKQIIFVFALFMSAWAWAQDVKVTHNLPSSASAGETIDAQFTVSKGSIGAFAKFQCDVPAGTQAAAGDTKSGNFTFENNRIKIVWVSLPGDPTFTFNVKITLSSSASGDQKFAPQFFYLENNVKKEFDVPPHTISIAGGGGGVTTTTPTETTSTTSTPTTTPTETTSTTSTPTTTPTETTSTTSTPTTTPTETTSTTSTPTTTPTETVATTPTQTTSTTPTQTTSTAPTQTTTTAPSRANVIYYVQVAALSTDPGLAYKKYGKMKVVIENGLYKVLIGTFNTLEDARKRKAELIAQGLPGCFVVGYENGVRIKI